ARMAISLAVALARGASAIPAPEDRLGAGGEGRVRLCRQHLPQPACRCASANAWKERSLGGNSLRSRTSRGPAVVAARAQIFPGGGARRAVDSPRRHRADVRGSRRCDGAPAPRRGGDSRLRLSEDAARSVAAAPEALP